MIFPFESGNQFLRKPQKIFLQNTNLLHALENTIGEKVKKGSQRELAFVQSMRDASMPVFYLKLY